MNYKFVKHEYRGLTYHFQSQETPSVVLGEVDQIRLTLNSVRWFIKYLKDLLGLLVRIWLM